MPARLALLAVACAALAFGALQLRDVRSCESAQRAATAAGTGRGDPARAASDLLSSCDGALPLATGSVAMTRARRPGEAERLASAAVRRQPDDYVSWLALAFVRQTRGDAAGAARARGRARELNPLAAALHRR